jgi:hypothetical protein
VADRESKISPGVVSESKFQSTEIAEDESNATISFAGFHVGCARLVNGTAAEGSWLACAGLCLSGQCQGEGGSVAPWRGVRHRERDGFS